MSLIRYNSVTLPYNDTAEFEITPLREDSNTDWFITRYRIRLQMILTVDLLSIVAPDLFNSLNEPAVNNAAGILKAIQQRLQQPRKELSFKFGSTDLIPSKPRGVVGDVDAMNGPLPDPCKITQFTNNLFLLEWGITAHYWTNYSINVEATPGNVVTNNKSSPMLFNRWSEKVSIDSNNYTTRTRMGGFQIRSDNFEGVTPDQLRSQMATISIPNGFTRTKSDYMVSPDGLKLQYELVDSEVFKPAPAPAFKAEGTYKQTTTKGNGTVTGQVNVRLWGSKTTVQATLLQTAVSVATAKLAGVASNGNSTLLSTSGGIILGAAIEVGMWENSVSCMIQCRFNSNRATLYGLSGLKKFVTATPSSDQNPTYVPPFTDRGTASILLQAAAYYDPNLANVVLGPAQLQSQENPQTPQGFSRLQLSRGAKPGQAGRNPNS